MKMPGFVKKLNPLPLLQAIGRVPAKLNPIKPLEVAMNTVLLSVIKKFLASAGKALITTLVAWLALATGVPAPTDHVALVVWSAFIGLVHALISALTRAGEHWFGVAPKV